MKLLKFELTEQDVTLLINILNQPHTAQAIHLAAFINLFQQQAAPQLATNDDGVPVELEERN